MWSIFRKTADAIPVVMKYAEGFRAAKKYIDGNIIPYLEPYLNRRLLDSMFSVTHNMTIAMSFALARNDFGAMTDCNIVSSSDCISEARYQMCTRIKTLCHNGLHITMETDACKSAGNLLLLLNTTAGQYHVDEVVTSFLNDSTPHFLISIAAIVVGLVALRCANCKFISKAVSLGLAFFLFAATLASSYYCIDSVIFRHHAVVFAFAVLAMIPLLLVAVGATNYMVRWANANIDTNANNPATVPIPTTPTVHNDASPSTHGTFRVPTYIWIIYIVLFLISALIACGSLPNSHGELNRFGTWEVIRATQVDAMSVEFLSSTLHGICVSARQSGNAASLTPEELETVNSFLPSPIESSSHVWTETYWVTAFRNATRHYVPNTSEVIFAALRHMFLCDSNEVSISRSQARYLYTSREEIYSLVRFLEDRVDREGLDINDSGAKRGVLQKTEAFRRECVNLLDADAVLNWATDKAEILKDLGAILRPFDVQLFVRLVNISVVRSEGDKMHAVLFDGRVHDRNAASLLWTGGIGLDSTAVNGEKHYYFREPIDRINYKQFQLSTPRVSESPQFPCSSFYISADKEEWQETLCLQTSGENGRTHEFQLATSIAITAFLQRCDSVRLVVVTSDEPPAGTLEKYNLTLNQAGYIFTRSDANEREKLIAAGVKREHAVTLNEALPIDAVNFLKSLGDLVRIPNPFGRFNSSLSLDTQNNVTSQLRIHKRSITHMLTNKSVVDSMTMHDYDLVHLKLKEIQTLVSHFPDIIAFGEPFNSVLKVFCRHICDTERSYYSSIAHMNKKTLPNSTCEAAPAFAKAAVQILKMNELYTQFRPRVCDRYPAVCSGKGATEDDDEDGGKGLITVMQDAASKSAFGCMDNSDAYLGNCKTPFFSTFTVGQSSQALKKMKCLSDALHRYTPPEFATNSDLVQADKIFRGSVYCLRRNITAEIAAITSSCRKTISLSNINVTLNQLSLLQDVQSNLSQLEYAQVTTVCQECSNNSSYHDPFVQWPHYEFLQRAYVGALWMMSGDALASLGKLADPVLSDSAVYLLRALNASYVLSMLIGRASCSTCSWEQRIHVPLDSVVRLQLEFNASYIGTFNMMLSQCRNIFVGGAEPDRGHNVCGIAASMLHHAPFRREVLLHNDHYRAVAQDIRESLNASREYVYKFIERCYDIDDSMDLSNHLELLHGAIHLRNLPDMYANEFGDVIGTVAKLALRVDKENTTAGDYMAVLSSVGIIKCLDRLKAAHSTYDMVNSSHINGFIERVEDTLTNITESLRDNGTELGAPGRPKFRWNLSTLQSASLYGLAAAALSSKHVGIAESQPRLMFVLENVSETLLKDWTEALNRSFEILQEPLGVTRYIKHNSSDFGMAVMTVDRMLSAVLQYGDIYEMSNESIPTLLILSGEHNVFEKMFYRYPKGVFDRWAHNKSETHTNCCSDNIHGDLLRYICLLKKYLDSNITSHNYEKVIELLGISNDCKGLDKYIPPEFEHNFSSLSVNYTQTVGVNSPLKIKQYIAIGAYSHLRRLLGNLSSALDLSSVDSTNISTDLRDKIDKDLIKVMSSVTSMQTKLNADVTVRWSDIYSELVSASSDVSELSATDDNIFNQYLKFDEPNRIWFANCMSKLHHACTDMLAIVSKSGRDNVHPLIDNFLFGEAEQFMKNMSADIQSIFAPMPCGHHVLATPNISCLDSYLVDNTGLFASDAYEKGENVTLCNRIDKMLDIITSGYSKGSLSDMMLSHRLNDLLLDLSQVSNQMLSSRYSQALDDILSTLEKKIAEESECMNKYSMELLEDKLLVHQHQLWVKVAPTIQNLRPALIEENMTQHVNALVSTLYKLLVDFRNNSTRCWNNSISSQGCLFDLYMHNLENEHYREALLVHDRITVTLESVAGSPQGTEWSVASLVNLGRMWLQCSRIINATEAHTPRYPLNDMHKYKLAFANRSSCRDHVIAFPSAVANRIGKVASEVNQNGVSPSDLLDAIGVVSLRDNDAFVPFFASISRIDADLRIVCAYVKNLVHELPKDLNRSLDSGNWREVGNNLTYAQFIDDMYDFNYSATVCGGDFGNVLVHSTARYSHLSQLTESYARNVTAFLLSFTNADAGTHPIDVDVFYSQVVSSYRSMSDIHMVAQHINLRSDTYTAASVQERCREHVANVSQTLTDELHALIGLFPSNDIAVYTTYHLFYKSLTKLSEISELAGDILVAKESVDKAFDMIFDSLIENLKRVVKESLLGSEKKYLDVQAPLVKLFDIIKHIAVYANLIPRVEEALENIPGSIAETVAGTFHRANISQDRVDEILFSLNTFAGYGTKFYYDRVNLDTPETVINGMTVRDNSLDTGESTDVFNGYFKSFSNKYVNLRMRNCAQDLPNHARNFTRSDIPYSDKIIGVMSCVFASWALTNTHAKVSPSAAQVIAIMRLFGVDKKGSNATVAAHLQNHLMQILTGEGKSIVLAVTGIICALFDYDVDIVTYSRILRDRDYNAFKTLVEAYQVSHRVSYGTYDDIFTKFLNDNGILGKLAKATVLGTREVVKKNNLHISRSQRKGKMSLLLLDEVDVFFNKLFYSECYNCMSKINDVDDIRQGWSSRLRLMTEYMWKNRANLQFESLQTIPEYKQLRNRYTNFTEFLDVQIKAMISALDTFDRQDHSYHVDKTDHTAKIGYLDKYGDAIRTNLHRGYDTMWAHFLEAERGNIDESERLRAIGLYLRCGSFSYAEGPKLYSHILGTTGTLSSDLLNILGPYKMNRLTFMPTAYKESVGVQWDNRTNVMIVEGNNFASNLTAHIEQERLRIVDNTVVFRPVVVILEDKKQLMSYYKSSTFKELKRQQGTDSVHIITESTSECARNHGMAHAMKNASVTLITKAFGRGTDFVCRDVMIERAGGAHIVQAYFAENLAEETQNKGRTGRQGRSGSFFIIMDKTRLEEQYGVDNIAEVMKFATTYDELDKLRTRAFEAQSEQNMRDAKKLRAKHYKSMEFLRAVWAENMTDADLKVFNEIILS